MSEVGGKRSEPAEGRPSVVSLPEERAGQHGESFSKRGKTSIRVSNSHGYLCHISTTAEYPKCRPELIFALFTNPDNTGVFRDVKKLTARKVLEEKAGFKIVEVEQLGEVRILWRQVEFKTRLTVTEDSRDPDNLKTQFDLISSDVLSKFNGSWHLQPLRQEGSGELHGTLVGLEQDVTPRGVPAFLKHVPLLGGVLRGICVRAVERMLEDISQAVRKANKGQRWGDIVKPATAEVHSHVLEDFSDSDFEDTPPASAAAAHAGRSPLGKFSTSESNANGVASAKPGSTVASHQLGVDGTVTKAGPEDAGSSDQETSHDGGFWERDSWPRH